MIVAVLLFVTAPAYAQPAPQRDPEREHGLLVGACLAALSETTRLTDIEVYGLLPRAVSECRLSPGPTLYRIKGGRVFEWGPMPERRER
jgi:hypothetical protein